MGALIEIRDMCKIYNPGENEVRALDHVNVTIDEGEFVAIIGQSGSGKSTLMNMLGCLDVPSSGSYRLHGQNVADLDDDELSDIRNKEIGFIFQGFNLIPNLTARENVELPLIYRGVSGNKREDLSRSALEKVGLAHRMEHKPAEMSGGQQQRVAIARAIAQAPPVILADEPTGNLDSHSTTEIMGILEELHKDGRKVILITHDIDLAFEFADKVAVFYAGTTVETAPASDFKTGPEALRHPYSKALWCALPQNGFTPIGGFQPYAGSLPTGCLFHPRCPHCTEECRCATPPMREVRGGEVRCFHGT